MLFDAETIFELIRLADEWIDSSQKSQPGLVCPNNKNAQAQEAIENLFEEKCESLGFIPKVAPVIAPVNGKVHAYIFEFVSGRLLFVEKCPVVGAIGIQIPFRHR